MFPDFQPSGVSYLSIESDFYCGHIISHKICLEKRAVCCAGETILIGLVWFGLVWFGLVWFGLI